MFPAQFRAGRQPFGKGVIIGEQAGHLAAKGHGARAGEGGDVHHGGGRPHLLGIVQGVAEHEPAFGVGILDLHRIAGGGAHHVAGAAGVAVGHVLGAGHEADDPAGGPFLGQGHQHGQHVGRAGHVAFHGVHLGGGLDADAAGVKGDALAHQHQRLVLLVAFGGVFQHHEARRPRGALAHGQQRAHVLGAHGFLVQHRAGQAHAAGDAFGTLGQIGRGRACWAGCWPGPAPA